MKSAVIIPLYDQSKYWERIMIALSRQSVAPDCIYVIVDRPSEDNGSEALKTDKNGIEWDCIEYIKSVNEKYPKLKVQIRIINNIPDNIKRRSDNYFLTGMARNIGLESAIYDECDIFVFIDGDCIPETNVVESHINKCKHRLPILSVGRRKEEQYRWMDQREYISSLQHLELFKNDGVVINNKDLLNQSLIVWSCNIALNLHAVTLIKSLNDKYYNRSELFSSQFLGAWGGEDSFLGIQAWMCKVLIATVGNKQSGVHHITHPRPSSKYTIDHKIYFQSECKALTIKHKLNPLNLEFFTQVQ